VRGHHQLMAGALTPVQGLGRALQLRHVELLGPGGGCLLLLGALLREPLLLGRGVGVARRLPAVGAVLRREPTGEAGPLVGGAVGQVVIYPVGAGVLHGPVRTYPRGTPFDGRYVRGRAAGLGLQIECLSLAVGVARVMRRTGVVWSAWRWSRGRFRLLRRLSGSCGWRLWPPWRWRRERWRAGAGAARWYPASGGTSR